MERRNVKINFSFLNGHNFYVFSPILKISVPKISTFQSPTKSAVRIPVKCNYVVAILPKRKKMGQICISQKRPILGANQGSFHGT